MSIMRKKIMGILIALVSIIFLVVAFWPSLLRATASEYRTFWSPDGNYKIAVYRIPSLSISMPGQSGDNPGYVRLYDKAGRILAEKDVEMVQNIDQVYWEDNKVDIKLFAVWNLPE